MSNSQWYADQCIADSDALRANRMKVAEESVIEAALDDTNE